MKEYLNLNTESKEKVEVDKEFLREITGFLLASSNLADEGKLPYPSFQNTSHYLACVLGNILDERVRSRECYMLYDRAVSRYENDPSVVKFNKELEELFDGWEN